MTLDGFFGMLHAALYQTGTILERSDDQWKEKLAQQSERYRLLRDSAYMLKHGRLDDRKPRLVRRSDQILTMPASFDAAVFDRAAFDTRPSTNPLQPRNQALALTSSVGCWAAASFADTISAAHTTARTIWRSAPVVSWAKARAMVCIRKEAI
jgi:hypothetical protein